VRTGAARAMAAADPVRTAMPAPDAQVDYLDIPAFLRRQAD